MTLLKLALITPTALIFLDYIKKAGDIILEVNASLKGWEKVLIQLIQRKKHSSRYESGMLSDAEKKYDATKRKC